MLSGETIICMAPDPWEGLWRNRHQIMTRLARRNTVLYVEPRLYFPETLRRLRTGRLQAGRLPQAAGAALRRRAVDLPRPVLRAGGGPARRAGR